MLNITQGVVVKLNEYTQLLELQYISSFLIMEGRPRVEDPLTS